ncbi:enoyl-CoA hydratase-related protein [Streptomyces sp. NPDC047968]|uniref:enoyl-CoA hydratase-related protein n=1 Tax=unclassified Streptomyces TaxID=2593676 RepID=UPI00341B8D5A
MRILLVANAYNSLSQRVHAELRDRGHRTAVEVVRDGADIERAVRDHGPELVLAPMLTVRIPRAVWSRHRCLVVHPGPPGDRGPSSLDWAVHDRARTWGATVLEAAEEMDAGTVWAWAPCPLPPLAKSDLYRGEVADAAVGAVLAAVERAACPSRRPLPRQPSGHRTRPWLRQEHRAIDWAADGTDSVLRALRAADSRPGVLDTLLGGEWYLHGGHPEDTLRGRPGELLATRCGAVCRATRDGAVWIPQLRPRRLPGHPAGLKLPAVLALGDRLPPLPEVPAPLRPGPGRTWREIAYHEDGPVGRLEFSFAGGAMGADQCRRLLAAYRAACERPTAVLVLGGGRDFFSNGIHLGLIEAAADPAAASRENLDAMNDLVEAVLTTTDRLVVAALGGNAAAGGVMLALAADEVWCRSGAVLNPHYRRMGLYGSEYWTYSLPRRVGPERAERLTGRAEPVTAAAARDMGLVDQVVDCGPGAFPARITRSAARLAALPATRRRIVAKKADREAREAAKPLAAYRDEESARMNRIFDDPHAPYHALRRAFVRGERPPAAAVARAEGGC